MMQSNEPYNKQKSNTAIMASSIGLGLLGSAATEGVSYGLMKAQIKYAPQLSKISGQSVDDIIKDAKMGVYGNSEEVAEMAKKFGFGGKAIDKFAKTGFGKAMMGGSSTKAGRISNYGIGLATSVIGGMMEINKQKKGER